MKFKAYLLRKLHDTLLEVTDPAMIAICFPVQPV